MDELQQWYQTKARDTGQMRFYEQMLSVLKEQMGHMREDYRFSLGKFENLLNTFAQSSVDIARTASGKSALPDANRCRQCGEPVSEGSALCARCQALQP